MLTDLDLILSWYLLGLAYSASRTRSLGVDIGGLLGKAPHVTGASETNEKMSILSPLPYPYHTLGPHMGCKARGGLGPGGNTLSLLDSVASSNTIMMPIHV